MGLLSVRGVPTYVFCGFAIVAALALAGRSAQIITGSRRISANVGVLAGIAGVAVGAMTSHGEGARRVAEILMLAAASYVVAGLGGLDELHEEYLAQRGGATPGPVAARLFYKTLGLGAGLAAVALVFVRGW